MMLYPRLRTVEARPLIELALTASLEELELDRPVFPRGVVWAPTGGERVSEGRLIELRALLRETAQRVGYAPGRLLEPRAPEGAALDRELARVLYEGLHLSAHEAAAGDMWRYFACILAPELVRWRFPGKEGSAQERFGSSLRRNLFGRMWWRAFTFHEPQAAEPWALLDALGEDEMVQITERPNAAGYRPLARGLARGLLRSHRRAPTLNRGNLLRDTMKRLLRRLPLLRYESLSEPDLDTALDDIYADSLRAAGAEVRQLALPLHAPRPAPAPAPAPPLAEPPRAWTSLSLARRYLFVRQLDAAELAELTRELKPSDPLESEPRWALLRGVSVPARRLVAALPTGSRAAERLNTSDLERWFEAEDAGSWVREVAPERALTLLRLLDDGWLRQWFAQAFGCQPEEGTWDLPRSILRQFDGDWRDLVGWIDEPICEGLLTMVSPGSVRGSDARSGVASWLVGHEVTAAKLGELLPPVIERDEDDDDDITVGRESARVSEPGAHTLEMTQWDALINDPRPLPEPPGLIRNLLGRLEVRSRGELARLDLSTLGKLPGVGRIKVEVLQEWRVKVLGVEPVPPAPAPEPVRQLPPEFAARALPPVPGLLEGLFAELGVVTYGDLMTVDIQGLRGMNHVGRRRIELVNSLREKALADLEASVPPRAPAPDLATLEAWVLGELAGRELQLITRRLIEGGSLLECGQDLGISRERARQILGRSIDLLRAEYHDDAVALLREECSINAMENRAVHRQMATLATVPFDRLRLPLTLVADGWTLIDGDWLVRGGGTELDRLLAAVDGWIDGRAEIEVASFNAAPVQPPVLEIILMELRGMRSEGDRWVVDTARYDKAEALLDRLRGVGSAHQDELARWLISKDGGSLDDDEVFRVARSVEGTLARQSQAYRTAMGTFTHRDALPIMEADLDRLVQLCVDRIRGLPGAISTRALLDFLSSSEELAGVVSPWLLKDALGRHPEVKPLRKFLVGYAPTFSEQGVYLTDRLEAILREAGVPLTPEEVTDRLPEGLDYSEAAIYGALRTGGIAASAGRGRFIWSPAADEPASES